MTKIGAETNNPPEHPMTIMITAGFSSQRVLINQLKSSSFAKSIRVIASHTDCRPELLSNADLSLIEPKRSLFIDWLLEQCLIHQIKVLIVSHNNSLVLLNKSKFVDLGVQLFAGAENLDDLQTLKDKNKFTQKALKHNLPVAQAKYVNNTTDLVTAIQEIESAGGVACVKPNIGVFASGFWQLDPKLPIYHSMMAPSSYLMNTQRFIEAYSDLADKQSEACEFLVMPFLSGLELSVDIFCANGKILSKATRIKNQFHQDILVNGPVDQIAEKFIDLFNCHGLINLQARQDDVTGEWKVLEINPRPAGGIGFSEPSGISLVVDCIAHALQLDVLRPLTKDTKVCVIDALHVISEGVRNV